MLLHKEVHAVSRWKILGTAANDPTLLAETMHARPDVDLPSRSAKFLANMLPVAKVTAIFLSEELKRTVCEVQNSSGRMLAIICDVEFFNTVRTSSVIIKGIIAKE